MARTACDVANRVYAEGRSRKASSTRDTAINTTTTAVVRIGGLDGLATSCHEIVAALVTSMASREVATARARNVGMKDIRAIVTASETVNRARRKVIRATNIRVDTAIVKAQKTGLNANTVKASGIVEIREGRAGSIARTAVTGILGKVNLATIGHVAVAVIKALGTLEVTSSGGASGSLKYI